MEGGKYTILSVAKTASNDKEEFGTHKLASYIQWAKKGYRRLIEDTIHMVKTIEMPLNDYNAIELSDIEGYVDWTKVGVRSGDKILVLGTADDIALAHDKNDCGVPIKNVHRPSFNDVINGPNLDSYVPFWFNGWYGVTGTDGSLQGWYGGYSYKGFFTENKERNQLQFSSDVNVPMVYIEYISDGTCCDGETEIDSRIFDYLVMFTHYESIRNKPGISDSEKRRQSQELHYELLRVNRIMNPITKEDLVNMLRKGVRMGPHI